MWQMVKNFKVPLNLLKNIGFVTDDFKFIWKLLKFEFSNENEKLWVT